MLSNPHVGCGHEYEKGDFLVHFAGMYLRVGQDEEEGRIWKNVFFSTP
jgi:hypothetical protein